MSYQFEDREGIPDGVKRVIREQIDQVLDETQANRRNRDQAIHNARTSLKKIRTALRLVRSAIGGDVFPQEDLCFRDAGRHLSGVRDTAVMVETLDALRSRFSSHLTGDAYTRLRKRLQQSNTAQRTKKQQALLAVAKTLTAARQRVEHWPIDHDSFSALEPGLQRAFRRGRQSFAQAVEQPSVENFHEWRKQVKCLWYQIRLLKPIWPGMLGRLADELKALSDYLSDDHDLAILRGLVLEQAEQEDDGTRLEVLVALIDQRRCKLEVEAIRLGARIYAEKPRAFVARVQRYWEAWRGEGQVDPAAVS